MLLKEIAGPQLKRIKRGFLPKEVADEFAQEDLKPNKTGSWRAPDDILEVYYAKDSDKRPFTMALFKHLGGVLDDEYYEGHPSFDDIAADSLKRNPF